jgi:four helix bundle protein
MWGMQDFTRLRVWQRAHELAVQVAQALADRQLQRRLAPYRATVGQLRRSSTSVSANIAEGCSQPSQEQFARFLAIAIGSATETQNHLLFLRDTNALPVGVVDTLLEQVEDFRPALIKLHATVSANARERRSTTNSRNT